MSEQPEQKQENVGEVVAAMRRYADILAAAPVDPLAQDIARLLREYADRVERAYLYQDTIYAGRNGEMTLDECIARCENNSGDNPRGRDIAQIGGWLRELRERRNARVDSSAIVEALGQCELFLLEIEKHGRSSPPPGDECVACKGVRELRSKLGPVLTGALIASPSMRSTLETIREKCVIYNNDLAEQIDALCGNALAEPARICDVLTKERLAETVIKAIDECVQGWAKVSELEKSLAYAVVNATVNVAYSTAVAKTDEPKDEHLGGAPAPDGAERGANGETTK